MKKEEEKDVEQEMEMDFFRDANERKNKKSTHEIHYILNTKSSINVYYFYFRLPLHFLFSYSFR